MPIFVTLNFFQPQGHTVNHKASYNRRIGKEQRPRINLCLYILQAQHIRMAAGT
jgi:hypothetical protein